jgi:hypothetical protein
MSGFVKTYVKFDQIKPHIDNACKAIEDYMAIFIFDDGQTGSGTFVNTCGFDGLLTARHVAEHLSKFEEFALAVANRPHGLWIPSDIMEHVPIGVVPHGSTPEDGPDLSFLIIRDAGLLEKLRTLKSFYPLDSSRLPCSPTTETMSTPAGICEEAPRLRIRIFSPPLIQIYVGIP